MADPTNPSSDWPDPEARRILTRCAEAARPSGRIMLVSGVNPGEQASPELLMLVLVGGRRADLCRVSAADADVVSPPRYSHASPAHR